MIRLHEAELHARQHIDHVAYEFEFIELSSYSNPHAPKGTPFA